MDARTVCKKWSQVLQDKLPFTPVLTDPNVKYLLNSEVRIECLTLVKLTSHAEFPISTTRSKFTSKVQRLKIHDLSTQTSLRILKLCGSVKELEFGPGALGDFKPKEFLSRLSFPHLRVLKISFPASRPRQSTLLRGFLKLKFPHLMVAAFEWEDDAYILGPSHNLLGFQREYIEVLTFIGTHRFTLQSLHVKPPIGYRMRPRSRVKDPILPSEDLRDQLAELNLRRLSLWALSFHGYGEWDYVDFLLRDQNQLVLLDLQGTIYGPSISQLIRRNSSTLVDVRMTIFYPSAPLDCTDFQNCSKLKALLLFVHNRKEFLNVNRLPTSLMSITILGGGDVLTTTDHLWISKNLVNLQRFSYLSNVNYSLIPIKFTHSIFKSMVLNTSVSEIEIWTGTEPKAILELCAATNGITFEYKLKGQTALRESWWYYAVKINRNLFDTPEVRARFGKFGSSYVVMRNVRIVIQP